MLNYAIYGGDFLSFNVTRPVEYYDLIFFISSFIFVIQVF